MDTPIVLKFGNTRPQETTPLFEDSANPGLQTGVRTLEHPFLRQTTTTSYVRAEAVDPEHNALATSTDNDLMLSLIHRALGEDHKDYAVAVHEAHAALAVHSAGEAPAWVACEDKGLEAALADFYNCPVGEPTMLLVTAGRDALIAQHLSTSAQPAAFNYGAISANTGASFVVGDTTLAGEITTAGGTLLRKQMTYTHSAGTNTATLGATWAANGSDALPVTIGSWAVLNAASVGTLGHELAVSPTATLSAVGDSFQYTFTWTAS